MELAVIFRNFLRSIFFAGFFVFATHALAQNAAPPQPIMATYEGQVYNGDNMDSVLTTFAIVAEKSLSGTYVVEEESGLESGNLTDCQFEGGYTVTCTWIDKYGKGTARILFASDYRSFSGYWGNSADTTMFPWNGVRKDTLDKPADN